MWRYMSLNPTVMTKTTNEGIERVRKGGYAYLLESTTNEYARHNDCNLTQVGDLLDSKGYGFGLRKNSIWTENISTAILMLQEKGKIHQLYNKWWKQAGFKNCEDSGKSSDKGSSLSFSNVAGVFAVLLAGVTISCFITALEFLWKSEKDPNIKVNRNSN